MLNENIEIVKKLLNEGYSDVEICSKIGLNWEEFWDIIEQISYIN
jgi:hypothetical protein